MSVLAGSLPLGVNATLNTSTLLEAFHNNTLGFGFSGSGFLIIYFAGVAAMLQSLGIINNTTKLAGSSGGAITAAALCSDVPASHFLATTMNISDTCRKRMNCRGTLGSVMQPALDQVITDALNSHHTDNSASAYWCSHNLYVTLTHARPDNLTDVSVTVGNFSSKEQLVSAIAASSYQPYYFGPSAVTSYDGMDVYDGQLSNALPCPPDVTYCVTVTPSAWDKRNTSGPFGVMSAPGTQAGSLSTLSFLTALRKNTNASLARDDEYLPFNPEVVPVIDQPDIYPGLSGPLPVTPQQWNSYTTFIPNDTMLLNMFNQGRNDTAFWAIQAGLANASAVETAMAATAPELAVNVTAGEAVERNATGAMTPHPANATVPVGMSSAAAQNRTTSQSTTAGRKLTVFA